MNELLAEAITFSVEDLAANREGRLSADQKMRLEKEFSETAGRGKKFTWALWAAAVALVVMMVAGGLPAELADRAARTTATHQPDTFRWVILGLACVSIAAAVLSTLFVLVLQHGRRNLNVDLPVNSVEGTAEKSDFETWYTLKVNGSEFVYGEGDDPVYAAFETGRRYRVYFISNAGNIIVSAESL